MKTFFKIAAASCLTFAAAPSAMASTIMIDDFDAFQRVVDNPFNPGEVNNSTVGPDASIRGGFRTMAVAATPNANGGAELVSTGIGNNFIPESALTLATKPGVSAVATVSYGTAAIGGSALGNLTGASGNLDKFFFDIIEDTPNFAGTTLTTTVTDNDSTFSFEENLDVGFSEYTSFSNFIGIDFTQVESLVFTFNTNDLTGFDASLASISVVPLPASALLLIGGLGGLFGVSAVGRRRRREEA